ncbi:MAG: serine/threonine-protein kinase [Planctomycetota bacterium]
MTNEEWRKVRALFDDAAGRSTGAEDLQRRLHGLGDDAAELARRLITWHADTAPGDSPDAVLPAIRPGDTIAGFTLEEQLGSGSYGVVYRATQRWPVREVALKLVPSGPHQDQATFEHEIDVLAGLDHPGIARVFTAGSVVIAGTACFYAAIELVRGSIITEVAATRSLREQLALLASVCDALQHAHDRGVMHCDIKPSNIMVSDDGVARLLDFGIARLQGRSSEGSCSGTPAYISPELLTARAEPTPASEVFAIGVVIHEVLAGRLPWAVNDRSLLAAVRRATQAPELSLAESLPADVRHLLRRCLADNPGERYAHVADVAEDLRRVGALRPVQARRQTVAYRSSKFIQRRPWTTGAWTVACLVLASLVLLAAIATTNAGRQRLAAQQSVSERRASDALSRLMLEAVRPQNLGPNATLYDTMEFITNRVAAGDLDAIEAANAQSRGEFYIELASRCYDCDLLDEAILYARRAVNVLEEQEGHAGPELSEARLVLARALIGLDDMDAAKEVTDQALRQHDRASKDDDKNALRWRRLPLEIAIHEGRYDDAVRIGERVLEDWQRVDSAAPEVADTLFGLGEAHRRRGDYELAEQLLRDAHARYRESFGETHPRTLSSCNSLYLIYLQTGRIEQSVELSDELRSMVLRVYGWRHPNTVALWNNMAQACALSGRLERARQLAEEALEACRVHHAEGDEPTRMTWRLLGEIASRQGRYAEAELWFGKALESFERVLSPGHFMNLQIRHNMAVTRVRAGYAEGSIDHFAAAWRGLVDMFGPGHPHVRATETSYVDALLETGRPVRVLEVLGTEGAGPDARRSTLRIEAMLAAGQLDEAEVALWSMLSNDEVREKVRLDASRLLADLFIERHEYRMAYEEYDALVRAMADDTLHESSRVADLYEGLARAHLGMGEYMPAYMMLKGVLDHGAVVQECSTKQAEWCALMAECALHMGDVYLAERLYDRTRVLCDALGVREEHPLRVAMHARSLDPMRIRTIGSVGAGGRADGVTVEHRR